MQIAFSLVGLFALVLLYLVAHYRKKLQELQSELSQLRQKHDAMTASLPAIRMNTDQFRGSLQRVKERMERFHGREIHLPPTVHLPEVPAGVDTAAQVPNRLRGTQQVPNILCRHCGRPLSGHGTEYSQCLTTLNPDGSTQEHNTTYEPIQGEFYTEDEIMVARKLAEAFPMSAEQATPGAPRPRCEKCGGPMKLVRVSKKGFSFIGDFQCPVCSGEDENEAQNQTGNG